MFKGVRSALLYVGITDLCKVVSFDVWKVVKVLANVLVLQKLAMFIDLILNLTTPSPPIVLYSPKISSSIWLWSFGTYLFMCCGGIRAGWLSCLLLGSSRIGVPFMFWTLGGFVWDSAECVGVDGMKFNCGLLKVGGKFLCDRSKCFCNLFFKTLIFT